MGLPAFADIDQLATRKPGGVSDADMPRAQTALEDASTAIRAFAGKTWVTDGELDLPTGDDQWRADVLVKVCCSAAIRVLDNPEGFSQQSIGSYSESRANPSLDVYLTTSERRDILRAAGPVGIGFGAFSIDTVACTSDVHADVCALRFGADYCSCGVDITGGFPLYELS